MTAFAPISGLLGGALIGLAAVLLMLAIGRVAGVTGIALNAMVDGDSSGRWWRVAFLIGLPLGASLVAATGLKDWGSLRLVATTPMTIAAGLIVGVGSTLGSGCTSGHGICGLARFSLRSVAATLTFVATGAVTVFLIRHVV